VYWDLPVARLDGPEREIALLVNYRASLFVERTRMQGRIRWLLFELDPALNPPGRSLDLLSTLDGLRRRLAKQPPSVLLRVIREQLARIRELTGQINAIERELRPLVRRHAGALLAVPGIGTINAARLIAEVADVHRFRTEARLALYACVAPLDASSGRQRRHRLNRSGNRQLNAALHTIGLTQIRIHPPARDYIARRRADGKSGREAVRALKRHLIRTI
jgi:transposase